MTHSTSANFFLGRTIFRLDMIMRSEGLGTKATYVSLVSKTVSISAL